MAPQLTMDTSSPMATRNGSDDSTQTLLTTQLYRSALHRQGLLLETQEDLRRIVLHDGLVSGLKDYLKKTQPTRVNRKRRTEEEKPEEIAEQKMMHSEVKKVKIVMAPRINRKRQSDDNINFAVEKKKIRPNEKEVVEEKKWKAEPVESKETKTDYEDPFEMDDFFAQLQIKQ